MKYGVLGEYLKHSFSKEIHETLANCEYNLFSITKDKVEEFITKREFKAINVTMPYKETVIPYLYFIDENAKNIGAVNTIVNRDGKLYGYNTDFYGMKALFSHAKIKVGGKKIAILGNGGTSKTARAVASSLNAAETLTVSRSKKDGTIIYDELYENHKDVEIIINATPAGMYPNIFGKPLELSNFTKLSGVVDVVYNPLRTPLILEARKRGIASEGGLYMLVAQAIRASEIFRGIKYDEKTLNTVFKKIKGEKENIVLTGMPASGKSTVGKLIAAQLGREFVDTDKLIEEKANKKIADIFSQGGEAKFREIESEVVREVSSKTGVIIATGGGAPIRPENVTALSENGRIYFIDRPLEKLIPTEDRPLASNAKDIKKRYEERYETYKLTADVRIDSDCNAKDVVKKIIEDFTA